MYLSPKVEAHILPLIKEKLKEIFPDKDIHFGIMYANFISANFDNGVHKYFKYVEKDNSVDVIINDVTYTFDKETNTI